MDQTEQPNATLIREREMPFGRIRFPREVCEGGPRGGKKFMGKRLADTIYVSLGSSEQSDKGKNLVGHLTNPISMFVFAKRVHCPRDAGSIFETRNI